MSHEIFNVGDMVYVGEKPWHDLGIEVSELMDLPSCLDWQTLKQAVYFASLDGTQTAKDYRALVRSDSGALLSIVSDGYQPHHNFELWKTFKNFAIDGNMKIETAGALKGGKIIWALARIDKSFDVQGDKHDLFALMTSRHDGAGATIFKPTAVRVVCNNTLTMALGRAENGKQLNQSHKSKFDGNRAEQFVASAILGFENYQTQVEHMKSVTLNGYSRAIGEAFVAELLAPQILEMAIAATGKNVDMRTAPKSSFIDQIVASDDSRNLFVENLEENVNRPLKLCLSDTKTEMNSIAGKTPFGLLQGITRYVDHTYGRNADNRLANAWLGAGDSLKSKALDLAIEYTEALTR